MPEKPKNAHLASLDSGRIEQKRRTRGALVAACRGLVEARAEVNMPAVAAAAGVSEATAYRYFPDLLSLFRAAINNIWIDPAETLAPVADSPDPVERIAYATEVLLRQVHRYETAVRAVIAATITRPEISASTRPGLRFGLIDHALAPLHRRTPPIDPRTLRQLRYDLSVIVSAEAFLTLTDLCELPPAQAIASAVHAARAVTQAATTGG